MENRAVRSQDYVTDSKEGEKEGFEDFGVAGVKGSSERRR